MKYTCPTTGNSLDELGIPKNPYFDPPPFRTFHFSIPTDTGLILSPVIAPATAIIIAIEVSKMNIINLVIESVAQKQQASKHDPETKPIKVAAVIPMEL